MWNLGKIISNLRKVYNHKTSIIVNGYEVTQGSHVIGYSFVCDAQFLYNSPWIIHRVFLPNRCFNNFIVHYMIESFRTRFTTPHPPPPSLLQTSWSVGNILLSILAMFRILIVKYWQVHKTTLNNRKFYSHNMRGLRCHTEKYVQWKNNINLHIHLTQ